VDPNDGTRDYLLGRRGSAVSIAAVHEGLPVLGVVFVFAYPDDEGDLFAWAEGCGPLRRNGEGLDVRHVTRLRAADTVVLSVGAARRPEPNLDAVDPARFRSVVSVAHRLALVAAGEAAAAASLYGPRDWDYAGGHALLRASGATLLLDDGEEVHYAPDGTSLSRSSAYGAHREVALALARRRWKGVRRSGASLEGWPTRLERGALVRDAGLLSRAQGCLLGQVAGDNLGALAEFESAPAIAERWADGPRRLEDGGTWNILAGQPTDDSELALALARCLVRDGRYDEDAVAQAYHAWLASRPFDVGSTIRAALNGHPSRDSQANGSLMRASPLIPFAHRLDDAEAGALGRRDSALTHPNPVCGDAVGAFVVAGVALLQGASPAQAHRRAGDWARRQGADPAILERLRMAEEAPPVCDGPSQGWVLIALQNAFFELLHAERLEDGVVATVRRGGDTDTNAAIAGALLGAAHGRGAVPDQWRACVLSCHAHRARAHNPRPPEYWPADVMELAERLLLARRHDGGQVSTCRQSRAVTRC
jgi:ADP-ribosylglycohydrolase